MKTKIRFANQYAEQNKDATISMSWEAGFDYAIQVLKLSILGSTKAANLLDNYGNTDFDLSDGIEIPLEP